MADHCAASPPVISNRKRASWACTLSTQALLCVALYAALSIGRPQTQRLEGAHSRMRRRDHLDLYFVSVRGGFWPPQQQAPLLEQMAKTVKTYNAEFVVNISDLGEDDPLTQNATSHYPLLNITWYTTTASHGHMRPNFFKRIKIPSGQALDIVGLDTGSLQLNETGKSQLRWLRRSLAMSHSSWHIVIGFDSLVSSEEGDAGKVVKFYEPLRNLFAKYGVNVYLSQQGCTGPYYHNGSTAFIGNPGPSFQKHHSHSQVRNSEVISDPDDGFLLHRVSPLEIETHFIESSGKVVFRSVIHQQGRDVM